jgi:hypothetical protein
MFSIKASGKRKIRHKKPGRLFRKHVDMSDPLIHELRGVIAAQSQTIHDLTAVIASLTRGPRDPPPLTQGAPPAPRHRDEPEVIYVGGCDKSRTIKMFRGAF